MTTLAELINAGFRSVAIDVTGVVIDANSKFAQKSELTSTQSRVTALEGEKLGKTEQAASALQANQDGNGNVIADTYVTKQDLIDVCNEIISKANQS